MKKRLLSLLLAMVMIVSMVPVQAFAEEADASELLEPAVVEEAAPEDISESTEESVPETTEETVPETTVETVPETTEETVPETTEETVPETTEEIVPETTEETIPELLEETIPEPEEDLLLEQDSIDEAPAEGVDGGIILVTPAVLSLRAGDDATLQAKLPTEDAVENDGIVYELAEGAEKYATLEGSVLTIEKEFEIPAGQTYAEFTVYAKAAAEDTAVQPAEITVKAYAKLSGIALYVNDSEEPTTTHTVNIAGEVKSFTVAVKATDGGPLGETTWTEPSAKLLTKAIVEDGVHTYTVKNKTGTATIKVASKTDKKVAATLTVKLVTAPTSFEIKELESFDKIGVSTLRAGAKVTLTTDINKKFTDKALKWEVNLYEEPGEEPNEGMAIEGDNQLASFVTIDQKGVLKASANVFEPIMVTVKASLISNPAVCDTIDILVQPAVNSFWVDIPEYWGWENSNNPSGEEDRNGAVNRKDKEPWYWDVNDGDFTLMAYDFSPEGAYTVKWSIPSSKAYEAKVDEDDPNVVHVTPKAPGKLTFTATATDGSGAKYSGTVNIMGGVRKVDITSTIPKAMKPGEKLSLTAKAYMDDDKTLEISKPKISWSVGELKDVTDEEWFQEEYASIYIQIGDRYYDVIDTSVASISRGKLVIGKVEKNTKLLLRAETEYGYGWAYDEAVINVTTTSEDSKALVLAWKGSDETTGKDTYERVSTTWRETLTPDEDCYCIVAAWMKPDGTIEPLGEGDKVTYTTSRNARYDMEMEGLVVNKTGTVTLKATVGKESTSATFDVYFRSTSVSVTNTNLTVTSGKSLKMSAKSWYEVKDPKYGGSEDIPATYQEFSWYLLGEDDEWVTETDCAKINTRTGVLTAKKVDETTTVTVVVEDYDWYKATAKVTILPKDKTFVTVSGAAAPATYSVNTSAAFIPMSAISVGVLKGGDSVAFTKEKVTVSPASLAKVTEDGIQLTGKTGTLTISVKGTIDGQTKPVTVRASIKLYNSVTSIEIVRPKDKKGIELPLFRGKSLKLSANVNKDATNKKLVWHVSSFEDSEGLWYGDKTTIKNGVLKADKSWYDDNDVYYVWATATDGSGISSKPVIIPVYSLATSVVVRSANPDTFEDVYFAENQVVTIQKGETGAFEAEVLNADQEDCYQGVTWTVTGNRKYVQVKTVNVDSGDFGVRTYLSLTGLKPGTVTVKATATDGSKKSTTFKVKVLDEDYTPVAVIEDGDAYDDLQDAVDAANGRTVRLLKDVTVDTLPTKAGGKTVYDLNGKTLKTTSEYTKTIAESESLTVTNGTLEMNAAGITAASVDVLTGGSVTLDGVTMTSPGCAFFPHGDAASVTIQDSEVTASTYCVATNAATTSNYNVAITLTNSTFTASNEYSDNCPVMINVPCTLKIDGCTITGQRQGVLVRAGTATIENSTIKTLGTYANKEQYYTGSWRSGNEVPAAALVVGSHNGSYKANAVCSMSNVSLTAENGFPAVYVDANATYSAKLTCDDDCTVSGDVIVGSNGITDVTIPGYAFTGEQLKDALEDPGQQTIDITLPKTTDDAPFTTNISIPAGKTVTLSGATNNPADTVIDGQIAALSSGTLTIRNCTIKVDSTINDATGISQTSASGIAVWGDQDVICENVVFDMSLADSTAITTWWSTGDGANITVRNCTFNCNGQRPIRSDASVTVENCIFNDPYRYAVQMTSKASTITAEGNAVVNFKNNTINAGTTSAKPVYGVQLEGGYGCSYLTINGSGNTINLGDTGKTGIMYVYEGTENIHDITWNVEDGTPTNIG